MTIEADDKATVSAQAPDPAQRGPVEELVPARTGFAVRLRDLVGGIRSRNKLGPLARRKERWFYLLISIWAVGFLAFNAGPILAAFGLSFSNFNLTQGAEWAGLTHYQDMLEDPLVIKTLGNTIYYTLGSVIISLILAFFLAVLLNQKVRGINIFRTFFFLPSVVSGVAVIMLWGLIFNPQFGMLNAFLGWFGIEGPAWLQDEGWAMPAVILMSVWNIGWMMLVYLAGLQGIPQELYEAAEIDGASSWSKMRHITIPLISPVTFFLLVTNIIFSFQVFTPTYVLTRGGPNNATMTMSLLIFLAAFQWNRMGFATAIAVVLFIIIMAVTVFQFTFSGRWVHYETAVD
ncbi:MAG: sugar ABC transporter permease [Anaerolineales bacterium]|nr:sugar ABC transporter permease [Anaerolineales bacterium]